MTHRRPFDPSLEERNRIQEKALSFAGIAIFWITLDGEILFIDGSTLDLLDLADQYAHPSELVGRNISELYVHVKEEGSFRQRVVAEGSIRGLEYPYVTLTGKQRWVEHNALVIRDETTGEVAIQSVMQNITERKRAEEALLRSEAKTRAILEATPDLYFVVSTDGLFLEVYANDRQDLLLSPEEAIGRHISAVLPREICNDFIERFSTVIETGIIELYEYTLSLGGSDQHFEARIVPYQDDELVVIVRNRTEQRRHEAERRALEERMRERQQLESIGSLAGGVAHDFNNLLTAIMGNIGMAKMELPPSSPVLPYLGHAETASAHAADLTKQLLAYAGRSHLQLSIVDLGAMTSEIGVLLASAISKGATLDLQLEEGIWVEGDVSQLRQVVMNLITNASEALPSGRGTISVRTAIIDRDALDATDVTIGAPLVPGRYGLVEVTDTGIGMDRATIPRAFEPFFSTKFVGRGLGLAACQGIARSHGGAIQVRSVPDKGTTMLLLVPLTSPPERTPAEKPSPRVPLGRAFTILCIDDEAMVRRIATLSLATRGHQVLQAEDGAIGLAAFEASRDDIDLVLLDLTMPRMDGREALARLRALDPGIPIIIMSGYSIRALQQEGLLGPQTTFIQKPFTPEQLLAEIEHRLR